VISFGFLELDPSRYLVTVEGELVDLTYAEFRLLAAFVRQPYGVLDRAQLARLLQDSMKGRGAPRSLRAVDTLVARLRAKLGSVGSHCIKTMRYVGYRFVPSAYPPTASDHSLP
jgi:DNA-binding response OmpR family regulator